MTDSRSDRYWAYCMVSAVLAFLAADTVRRVEHLCALRALNDFHVASPALDPVSETGYAHGERRLVLPGATIDSDHQIMQAQRMLAGGPWRVRTVNYDNAPQGREVHWAFPLRAWLGFLALVRHWATELPLGACVEDAGLVANPILLAIFLILAVPWAVRRFGLTAGALLAGGAVCMNPFYLNFEAGNAEHQGMAAALALLTVAPLLTGRTETGRRGFLASAIAGDWVCGSARRPRRRC